MESFQTFVLTLSIWTASAIPAQLDLQYLPPPIPVPSVPGLYEPPTHSAPSPPPANVSPPTVTTVVSPPAIPPTAAPPTFLRPPFSQQFIPPRPPPTIEVQPSAPGAEECCDVPSGPEPAKPTIVLLPMPYRFRYSIGNSGSSVFTTREEEQQKNGPLIGQYSYKRPDGVYMTVAYTADENGYRAKILESKTPPPNLPSESSNADHFRVRLPGKVVNEVFVDNFPGQETFSNVLSRELDNDLTTLDNEDSFISTSKNLESFQQQELQLSRDNQPNAPAQNEENPLLLNVLPKSHLPFSNEQLPFSLTEKQKTQRSPTQAISGFPSVEPDSDFNDDIFLKSEVLISSSDKRFPFPLANEQNTQNLPHHIISLSNSQQQVPSALNAFTSTESQFSTSIFQENSPFLAREAQTNEQLHEHDNSQFQSQQNSPTSSNPFRLSESQVLTPANDEEFSFLQINGQDTQNLPQHIQNQVGFDQEPQLNFNTFQFLENRELNNENSPSTLPNGGETQIPPKLSITHTHFEQEPQTELNTFEYSEQQFSTTPTDEQFLFAFSDDQGTQNLPDTIISEFQSSQEPRELQSQSLETSSNQHSNQQYDNEFIISLPDRHEIQSPPTNKIPQFQSELPQPSLNNDKVLETQVFNPSAGSQETQSTFKLFESQVSKDKQIPVPLELLDPSLKTSERLPLSELNHAHSLETSDLIHAQEPQFFLSNQNTASLAERQKPDFKEAVFISENGSIAPPDILTSEVNNSDGFMEPGSKTSEELQQYNILLSNSAISEPLDAQLQNVKNHQSQIITNDDHATFTQPEKYATEENASGLDIRSNLQSTFQSNLASLQILEPQSLFLSSDQGTQKSTTATTENTSEKFIQTSNLSTEQRESNRQQELENKDQLNSQDINPLGSTQFSETNQHPPQHKQSPQYINAITDSTLFTNNDQLPNITDNDELEKEPKEINSQLQYQESQSDANTNQLLQLQILQSSSDSSIPTSIQSIIFSGNTEHPLSNLNFKSHINDPATNVNHNSEILGLFNSDKSITKQHDSQSLTSKSEETYQSQPQRLEGAAPFQGYLVPNPQLPHSPPVISTITKPQLLPTEPSNPSHTAETQSPPSNSDSFTALFGQSQPANPSNTPDINLSPQTTVSPLYLPPIIPQPFPQPPLLQPTLPQQTSHPSDSNLSKPVLSTQIPSVLPPNSPNLTPNEPPFLQPQFPQLSPLPPSSTQNKPQQQPQSPIPQLSQPPPIPEAPEISQYPNIKPTEQQQIPQVPSNSLPNSPKPPAFPTPQLPEIIAQNPSLKPQKPPQHPISQVTPQQPSFSKPNLPQISQQPPFIQPDVSVLQPSKPNLPQLPTSKPNEPQQPSVSQIIPQQPSFSQPNLPQQPPFSQPNLPQQPPLSQPSLPQQPPSNQPNLPALFPKPEIPQGQSPSQFYPTGQQQIPQPPPISQITPQQPSFPQPNLPQQASLPKPEIPQLSPASPPLPSAPQNIPQHPSPSQLPPQLTPFSPPNLPQQPPSSTPNLPQQPLIPKPEIPLEQNPSHPYPTEPQQISQPPSSSQTSPQPILPQPGVPQSPLLPQPQPVQLPPTLPSLPSVPQQTPLKPPVSQISPQQPSFTQQTLPQQPSSSQSNFPQQPLLPTPEAPQVIPNPSPSYPAKPPQTPQQPQTSQITTQQSPSQSNFPQPEIPQQPFLPQPVIPIKPPNLPQQQFPSQPSLIQPGIPQLIPIPSPFQPSKPTQIPQKPAISYVTPETPISQPNLPQPSLPQPILPQLPSNTSPPLPTEPQKIPQQPPISQISPQKPPSPQQPSFSTPNLPQQPSFPQPTIPQLPSSTSPSLPTEPQKIPQQPIISQITSQKPPLPQLPSFSKPNLPQNSFLPLPEVIPPASVPLPSQPNEPQKIPQQQPTFPLTPQNPSFLKPSLTQQTTKPNAPNQPLFPGQILPPLSPGQILPQGVTRPPLFSQQKPIQPPISQPNLKPVFPNLQLPTHLTVKPSGTASDQNLPNTFPAPRPPSASLPSVSTATNQPDNQNLWPSSDSLLQDLYPSKDQNYPDQGQQQQLGQNQQQTQTQSQQQTSVQNQQQTQTQTQVQSQYQQQTQSQSQQQSQNQNQQQTQSQSQEQSQNQNQQQYQSQSQGQSQNQNQQQGQTHGQGLDQGQNPDKDQGGTAGYSYVGPTTNRFGIPSSLTGSFSFSN